MPSNPLKILVIDGTSKVRDALSDLLTKQLGCNTLHVAANGVEGWEMIQKHGLDLLCEVPNYVKLASSVR